MISTDRLNIFLHVVETHSFSTAAQRLHISQPTVSKQIKELESELKTELFLRGPGGVQLTEAGKTLVPWARKLVRDCVDLENMMGSLDQEISGHLKIACSTTSGKYILPQLAARFREKNLGVRISILPCTQENIALQLLSEEADLGVASIELVGVGVECQPFLTDEVILIVPAAHPWVKRSAIDPEELLDEPILLREPTSGTRRVLQTELAQYDIALDDLNVLLEVGNAEAIVLTVSAGLGISFVSRMAAAYAQAWGRVVEVPVNGLKLQRQICIGRKMIGPPNRAMDAFWGFIHAPENDDLLQLPKSK
ncbi:MAG: LysR family transcriptional regulator [Anaerolineales bacterium]|nr:LysR family transcriptional regulator [Anaerolineales bacterium]